MTDPSTIVLEPCVWRNDRHRNPNRNHHSKSEQLKHSSVARRFAGVDGEGWGTDKHGRQDYRLIVAADKDGLIGTLTKDGHLGWAETLHWLVSLPRDRIYCGYGLGYDITQILRTLPAPVIQKLMRPEERMWQRPDGTWYRGMAFTPRVPIGDRYWYFGLDYIPRKQLKVTAWYSPVGTWEYNQDGWTRMKTFTLWDVFSFFQSRFLTAAIDSKIIAPDMLEIIAAGKERRGAEPEHDLETELAYCKTECQALAAMMENVNRLCCEAGYPLRDYYGAGSIATAMMRVEKTKAHTHPVNLPQQVLDASAFAFFGGRFENRMFGKVGDLYEYDINSAYPHIQSTVPCLVHGEWKQTTATLAERATLAEYRDKGAFYTTYSATKGRKKGRWVIPVATTPGQIGLYYVEWSWFGKPKTRGGMPTRPPWGPFMQRDEHSGVHSPPHGEGWICANEYDAAKRWVDKLGPDHFNSHTPLAVLDAWTWHPTCDAQPFAYMAQGYELRKQLKKAGDGRQLVYKLGLNSHSGKCDQTVGSAPWHHPFLAAWIKAGCRGMLLDAIAQNPDAVVGVATDAVYSSAPLGLPLGDKLGEWSTEYKRDAFLFQPGIGWGVGDEEWVKRRGLARLSPELRKQVTESFARDGDLTTITVEQPIFYGLARDREKYKLGRWGMLPRTVGIGPGNKRFFLLPEDTPQIRSKEQQELYKKIHETLLGETIDELPPIEPYTPQPMYDTAPKDGLYDRCGYAYPKFVAFWRNKIPTAVEPPEMTEERQRLDDESDAILEREWLVDDG